MTQTQQITFNDGTKVDIMYGKRGKTFFDDTQRDCVELQFDPQKVNYELLDQLTFEPESILLETQEDDMNVSFVLENHSIRTAFGKKPVKIMDATDTEPAVYQERLYVVLAKRTYQEIQYRQQVAAIQALGQQVTALTLRLMGGTEQ